MLHVDTLIGEELRLIPKGKWDSIEMPMLVPRRAEFRNLPKYFERTDLDEPTRVWTITSNRTKSEWFNRMYNNTFVNYFKNTLSTNRIFSADIFLALRHGLKKKAWYLQQQKEMDELSFRMEILNETIGEVEGAFFSWEQFRKNQSIKKALIPPNPVTFKANKSKNRAKKNGEVRLIFADFAFTDKTNSNAVDNTCIGIMSIIPKGDKYYRLVEFIETRDGGDGDGSKKRLRELFWDFGCDYIVFDSRNGGDLLAVDLSKEFIHPYRTINEWNSHGFTACVENDLHMVGQGKVADLRAKCVDPNAVPCLIPITASRTSNSDMWLDLGSRLKSGDIQFLIDDLEFETSVMTTKDWHSLTDEEKAELKTPHLTTQFMINEAVNLKQTWTEGYLKLNEPLSGTKDCIVALAYGNFIASKIINKLEKNNQETEFDIKQWKLSW